MVLKMREYHHAKRLHLSPKTFMSLLQCIANDDKFTKRKAQLFVSFSIINLIQNALCEELRLMLKFKILYETENT